MSSIFRVVCEAASLCVSTTGWNNLDRPLLSLSLLEVASSRASTLLGIGDLDERHLFKAGTPT